MTTHIMLILCCIFAFTAMVLPIMIFLLRLRGKYWISKMRVFTFFMFLSISGYLLVNGAVWSFYFFATELYKQQGVDWTPNSTLLIVLAAVGWMVLPLYTALLFPFYMLLHSYIYRKRLKRHI